MGRTQSLAKEIEALQRKSDQDYEAMCRKIDRQYLILFLALSLLNIVGVAGLGCMESAHSAPNSLSTPAKPLYCDLGRTKSKGLILRSEDYKTIALWPNMSRPKANPKCLAYVAAWVLIKVPTKPTYTALRHTFIHKGVVWIRVEVKGGWLYYHSHGHQ